MGFGVSCQLPITWSPSNADANATNSGVGLFDAVTGAISATAQLPPLHFLTGGPSYDRVVGKWLPVPASAVAPDGLHYAYAEWDPPASGMAGGVHAAAVPTIGTKGRVHLVDARTGADAVLYSGEPTYAVAGFVAEGVLLSKFAASTAGIGYSGLYLLKLDGGVPATLPANSQYPLDRWGWQADGDAGAWGIVFTNGMGGLGPGNELLRFNLSTQAIETWLLLPQDHTIQLLGLVDHHPVVLTAKGSLSEGEPIDAHVLILTAPNQSTQLMATDQFSDPLPGDLVQDSTNVWFGGLGMLWLYDGSSMRHVSLLDSQAIVDVGGPCVAT
jgi:hypothetical protein